MKKLLTGLGILLALGVLAALIVPSFFDWNQYKGEIAAKVKEATGRALAIDGDITLALLPTPKLAVAGVRLADLPGASNPDMVRLKALEARVAFAPLLEGRLQIESLDLIEPQVRLEQLADGRLNWEFVPEGPGAAPPGASGSAGKGPAEGGFPAWLQLDHLTVQNGSVSYRNAKTGRLDTLGQINGGLSAGTQLGPFRAQLRAVLGTLPIALDATLERVGGDRPVGVGLRLTLTGAQLDLTGSTAPGKDGRAFTGKLRVTSPDLRAAAAMLGLADGAALPAFLAQSLGLDGTVSATAKRLALDQLSLRLGESEATGRVSYEPGEPGRASAVLALGRIDLDKWLALKAPPLPLPPAGAPPAAPRTDGSAPVTAPLAAPQKAPLALPRGLDATIDVSIDGLLYRGGAVRQVRFGAALNNGELALNQLTAELPGGSDVTIYGALRTPQGQPSFTGNLEAASDILRGLFDWLKIDVSGVPAERLRKLALGSAVLLTPSQLQLRDVDMTLDSSHLVGGATILLQPRPAFGASVAVDRLNLDAYLPQASEAKPDAVAPAPKAASPAAAVGAAGPGAAAKLAALEPLRLLGEFDANLRARVDELVYRGERIRGVRLDGTVQGGAVTVREARVDDLAGLQGQLSGSLLGSPQAPVLDVAFDANAAELASLLRFAGLKPPVPADRLGALAVKGRAKGGLDALAVDLDGSVMGGAYKLAGTLGLGAAAPSYDLALSAKQPQLARLVRFVVTDPALGDLGTLELSGRLTGEGDAIAVSGLKVQSGLLNAAGDFSVRGWPGKPSLKADVSAATPRLGTLLALAGVKEPQALDRLGPVEGVLKADGDTAGFTLDGKLSASGGSLAVAGKVATANKGPSYDVTVTGGHAELATLLQALAPDYRPAAAKLGEVKLQAKLVGNPEKLDVSALEAKLGPTALSGTVKATLDGARPKLAIRLEASALDLNPLLPGEAAANARAPRPRGQAAAGANPRWSTAPIELAALKVVDADVALAAPSLVYGPYRLENAKLAATLENGVLALAGLTGKLYGGDFKLAGKLDGGAVAKASLSLRLEGANLGQAGLKLGGVKLSNGVLAASAELATSGGSELALARGLNGSGALKMASGVIEGFDLAAVDARLAKPARAVDLIALVQAAMSGGESKLKRLEGSFTVKDGLAENKDLAIEAEGANGKGQGTLDLPRWYMEYEAAFKLTGAADVPPFTVKLKGAPDEPRKILNANELQEYLLKREAGAVLKDVGKAEKGLSVIKGSSGGQTAAPPAQGEPGAQPPPQPQPKPTTPESIIQDLLKGLRKKPSP